MERNKMNLFVDCCVFLLLSCLVCEVTLKKTENFESNKYDEDREFPISKFLIEEDFLVVVDKEDLSSYEKIDQSNPKDISGSGVDKQEDFSGSGVDKQEDFSGSGVDKQEEFPDDATDKKSSGKDPTFRWINGKWNPCSASCGGGFRTRSTLCQRMDKMLIVDEKYCFSEPKLKEQKYKCNSSPCPRWVVGNWSECNPQCTVKFRTRKVRCSAPPKMLTDIPCIMLPKPRRYQFCFRNPNCTSVWKASDWSECHQSPTDSLYGTRNRTVTCVYQVNNEPSNLCRYVLRPKPEEICEMKKRSPRICRDRNHSHCQRFSRTKKNHCRRLSFRMVCCRSCRHVSYQKKKLAWSPKLSSLI